MLAWQRFHGLPLGATDTDAKHKEVFEAQPPDGTRAVLLTFDDNASVVLARIEGGGHTWPGGWGYLPEFMIGKTSRAWNASAAMWAFFSRSRMRFDPLLDEFDPTCY